MHLKIFIRKTIDGYTAEVPSVKGCEVWSNNSEDALKKVIDLLAYYLKKENNFKYKLDCNKKSSGLEIYTIVL